jgi:hypothetical protein
MDGIFHAIKYLDFRSHKKYQPGEEVRSEVYRILHNEADKPNLLQSVSKIEVISADNPSAN